MAASAEQTHNYHIINEHIHHEVRHLNPNLPLISLEDNRRLHNVNAAVLAELTLPTKNSQGERQTIHLLDFGEDIGNGKAFFYMPDIATDMSHLGVVTSRFVLSPANYVPPTHLIGYSELSPGDTTIGREWGDRTSYLLGISDGNFPKDDTANKVLSRKHLTLRTDGHNSIFVEDHSTNGTGITFVS